MENLDTILQNLEILLEEALLECSDKGRQAKIFQLAYDKAAEERNIATNEVVKLRRAIAALKGLPQIGRPPGIDTNGVRANVLSIITEDGTRLWRPAEIHDVLKERGFDYTPHHVSSAISKLWKANEIVRVGEPSRGRYRLPG